MLSHPGDLPSGSAWSFELKWDGFRALVSTESELRVRSRRSWNMTSILPELRALPAGLVLDGELIAWKGNEPYFPLVCRRVLNGDTSVPLTFVVFDVLRRDGVDLNGESYRERRSTREAQARRASLDAESPANRVLSLNGAAPESNRPSRGLHDRTGFEDQLGHRAHAAPALRLDQERPCRATVGATVGATTVELEGRRAGAPVVHPCQECWRTLDDCRAQLQPDGGHPHRVRAALCLTGDR
jgi:ATP dependent DNA ligase domain